MGVSSELEVVVVVLKVAAVVAGDERCCAPTCPKLTDTNYVILILNARQSPDSAVVNYVIYSSIDGLQRVYMNFIRYVCGGGLAGDNMKLNKKDTL